MPNLFNKNIKYIEYSDIQELIDNETPESLILDYKKDFDFSNPKKTNDERNQEIAKDITGLANSSGGYLIYGIKENSDGTNTPEKIIGIDGKKGSQNIEDWLNQLMANGKVSPNVNYATQTIKIPDTDKIILVLEIDESLNKPHMVLYNNAFCYYTRSGTETKKADHLQVKTMFEFKDKYLLDFNNFRKKLNLDKDGNSENFALSHFNQKLISFQNKEPITTFTLIPYNLNRNINFIKDRFFEGHIKNTKDTSELFKGNFLNKKLNHLGITYYDSETEQNQKHKFYFHIYKNGAIEFGCGHKIYNDAKYIKYWAVQILKDFLFLSKGILEYLEINEFNLNVTALNVLDSKLSIHSDFNRYYGVSHQKLETNTLQFEYDLTPDNLNELEIRNTLAEFSDNLLAVFDFDMQSENLSEFTQMFEKTI